MLPVIDAINYFKKREYLERIGSVNRLLLSAFGCLIARVLPCLRTMS